MFLRKLLGIRIVLQSRSRCGFAA